MVDFLMISTRSPTNDRLDFNRYFKLVDIGWIEINEKEYLKLREFSKKSEGK